MNSEDYNLEENNRLKYFPITMYAVTMGIGGLTLMYQKAAEILNFPHLIGNILMYIDLILFISISIIYLIKYIKYPAEVKKEWNHSIRINFFAAISISLLILAIAYKEEHDILSSYFWYIAVALHFFLTMHTIKFWINSNQELSHSNPAWFIPIVGNVLIPVGGIGFAPLEFLMYFFSVGIFFWIILFTILLNRIIFHHQLADKFMPTLFIFIAPPAISFIAYYKMYGIVDDAFASILFNLTIFFVLLLAFMIKNFIKINFFISWWAFTFPLASSSMAVLLMYSITHNIFLLYFSYVLIIITTLVFTTVLIQTIKHMFKNEVCINE